MKLACVLCGKEFVFDTARLPDQGFRISCSACGTKYSVLFPPGWRDYHVPSAGAEAAASKEPVKDTGENYILLADDTEFFRALMTDLLTKNGFKVKSAADGQEALDIFKAAPNSFSLIILDLQMPRLSGFAVLEQLSKTGQKHPPVIVMTGVHDSHEDIQIVRDMGAAGFLDKSLDPSVAIERIKMVLARQHHSA